MNINLSCYPKLQSVLKQDKPIVYLCGAGLSMALGSHRYSWDNWISTGSEYMSAAESKELKALLDSPKETALINAAGYAIQKTKENGTYNDYMNNTIGSLTIKDDSLASSLQCINRAGDFIATTNYDLLIEEATSLGSYTYTQSGDILKSVKGEVDRKVIHLHGLYDFNRNIDDIVANSSQYDSVVANQAVQFIQNLLSTNTIIVIGCGATVDDPNLSGFLSFAQKELGISFPYFYLYKGDSDDLDMTLPDNFIPVSYGEDYGNLTYFLDEIVLYRLNHLAFSKVMRVNPYVNSTKKGSAYGRLHFSNEFSLFTGRKEELQRLNEFRYLDQNLSWWVVTGKAGFGKSRLLLEWLSELPKDWFGFFGEIKDDSVYEYSQFKPFNNTIVVFDNILGNESNCAMIISTLFEIFEDTPYKLRIIIADRFYNESKLGWYDTLLSKLKPSAKIKFIDSCYTGEKLVPMKVGELLMEDELEHVQNYLESYIEILDDIVRNEYKPCLAETAQIIHEEFCSSLNDEHRRPLFFNVFVEVWISKDGKIDIQNVRGLLGHFLEKETNRWLLRFNGDNELLYAYQILLAFAAASQFYVLQDKLDIYQKYSDELLSFVESEKVAGKRKKSLDDLSIYQEYAQERDENGAPILLTVLAPEYPDIILEFIVDCYIDKEYWIIFAQEVREYENVWFNSFLVKGMEDFSDSEIFLEMYFAPLKDPRDTFGFFVGILPYVREFAQKGKLPQIIDTLSAAGMSNEFGLFEIELWRRIVVVYSERKEYEELYHIGLRFTEYIKQRKQIHSIIKHVPEVVEGFCIELLNAKQFDFIVKLIKHFDNIAYDGYIGTVCSRAYYFLINNQLHYQNSENITMYLKGILLHLRKYPKDDDIIGHFVDATDKINETINQNDDTALLISLVPITEQAYDCSKSEKIAEVLAILEASRFSIAVMTSNNPLAQKSQKRINRLFKVYRDNEDIILSYASVTASMYIEEPKHISDKEIEQFKSWKDIYPGCTGILESYGKILLAKWLNMTNGFDKENAKHIFREVEDIAKILSEQHKTPELLLTTLQIREMDFYLGFYDL